MVRKCKNPWCEGTGKVHPAAFAFCRTCWGCVAGLFIGVSIVHVLDKTGQTWALWALFAGIFVVGAVWFAVVWRRSGFAGAWRRVKAEALGKAERVGEP